MACFVLRFLLRTFFKTFGEPLYLLTVHPKLNFRGALRKSLIVAEDRSYQTQYFAKIFPIQVFPLHILCYFSKTWLKIWRKSWWSSLFLWNRLILQIFFFLHTASMLLGKLPNHAWLEKNCVYEAPPLFFLLKHFRLFIFLINCY